MKRQALRFRSSVSVSALHREQGMELTFESTDQSLVDMAILYIGGKGGQPFKHQLADNKVAVNSRDFTTDRFDSILLFRCSKTQLLNNVSSASHNMRDYLHL